MIKMSLKNQVLASKPKNEYVVNTPSPCGFLKFAEALSDKQWEDITRKYVDGDEIDFYAVARSVSNRKYYRKEVEQ